MFGELARANWKIMPDNKSTTAGFTVRV